MSYKSESTGFDWFCSSIVLLCKQKWRVTSSHITLAIRRGEPFFAVMGFGYISKIITVCRCNMIDILSLPLHADMVMIDSSIVLC